LRTRQDWATVWQQLLQKSASKRSKYAKKHTDFVANVDFVLTSVPTDSKIMRPLHARADARLCPYQ